MEELFRDQDILKVSFYKQLLEAQGIPTMVRPNKDAMKSGWPAIPFAGWAPSIWVAVDPYDEEAMDIIRKHMAETDKLNQETRGHGSPRPDCGETDPGNLAECWSCQKPLHDGPD